MVLKFENILLCVKVNFELYKFINCNYKISHIYSFLLKNCLMLFHHIEYAIT